LAHPPTLLRISIYQPPWTT